MIEKTYNFKSKKRIHFLKKKLFVSSMWKLTLGYASYFRAEVSSLDECLYMP